MGRPNDDLKKIGEGKEELVSWVWREKKGNLEKKIDFMKNGKNYIFNLHNIFRIFFSRALFNIRKKYIFFKDFSKTFDKKYIFLFQNS